MDTKKKDDAPVERRDDEPLFSDSDDDPFPEIECDLCSKSFSNVRMYEQHLSSKKHFQKLSNKKLMKKISGSEAADDEQPEQEPEQLQCDVCEKSFSGYKPYISHIKGSTHAKNLKEKKLRDALKDKPGVLGETNSGDEPEDDELLQKPFARCSICQKVLYDASSYQTHMAGGLHKKKLLQQRTRDSLKNDHEGDLEMNDEELFSKCEICNKSFSGPVPYKMHLSSAVHKSQVKRVKEMEKLKDYFTEDSETGRMVCNECKKPFPDPFAFKLHLDSNSHEKQSAKDKMLDFVKANPEIVAMKSVHSVSSEDESDEDNSYEKGYYFLVCKLCHTSFTGLESATDHVKSKKHINAKKDKEKMKLMKIKIIEKQNGSKVDAVNDQSEENVVNNKNSSTLDGVDAGKASLPKNAVHHSEVNDDFELI